MPAPNLTAAAQRVYEQLAPIAHDDEANGYAAAHLVAAMARMVDPIHFLLLEGPAPWSNAVDLDAAPTNVLPWLGQFPGVTVTAEATDAQQRDEVRNAAGFTRGTPDAIRGAVARTLTGTQSVRIVERDGSAYRMTVLTRTAETTDPVASEAAARSQKPAGIVLTFTVSDTPIINEATLTIDGVAAGVTIDSAQVGQV